MEAVFGAIGLVGLAACLVWFVYALIKKTPRKKIAYAALVCLALTIIGFATTPKSSADDDAAAATESAPIETVEAAEGSEPVETAEETEDTEPAEGWSVDDCISLIEASLATQFDESTYTVKKLDGMVEVDIWVDGLAVDAGLAMQGQQEYIDSWNDMVDGAMQMTESFQTILNSGGHSDTAVLLQVLNDLDKDKSMLSISYGTVLYDMVNDVNVFG